jgi:tRNA-modifying protein YgfZ
VAREYAAAREGAGLADLEGRAVLAVTGPLRVKFLHGILSNELQSKTPGQGVRAALMDVKGHVLALLRALVTDDAVLLEIPADRLDVVEPLLVHYRVAAPVRFARRDVSVLGLVGPRAPDVLRRAGAVLPAAARPEDHVGTSLGGRSVRIARAGDLPAEGWVVHAVTTDAAGVREALATAGASHIGRPALDVLRIEDGRPWYGPDVTAENLLHETGLVGEYHSSSKGCYVGQEVIARLEARGGNVNKVLRGLRLAAPVAAGAVLTLDGRDVGRVTTAGVSPRLGAIAMAFVHRSAAEPGTEVRVGSTSGTTAVLPLAG